MKKRQYKLYLHYPAVAAVVTVQHEGRSNALACVWHTALSFEPPLYAVSISPKRFSYDLIQQAGAFAVNFLPQEKADLIARFGRNSGRDLDKFAVWEVETLPLEDALAPILADAYAAYECKLYAQHTYGDHDLFVGEIVRLHQAEGAFGENRVLNIPQVKPALYLGANLYATLSHEPPVFRDGSG